MKKLESRDDRGTEQHGVCVTVAIRLDCSHLTPVFPAVLKAPSGDAAILTRAGSTRAVSYGHTCGHLEIALAVPIERVAADTLARHASGILARHASVCILYFIHINSK